MKPDLNTFNPLTGTLPGTTLFMTVSGAHLYGFPSPDSDVDLRGVFILPQRALLGLDAPEETFSQTTQFAGYEVDLVAHEVKKFLELLLRKNGSMSWNNSTRHWSCKAGRHLRNCAVWHAGRLPSTFIIITPALHGTNCVSSRLSRRAA